MKRHYDQFQNLKMNAMQPAIESDN